VPCYYLPGERVCDLNDRQLVLHAQQQEKTVQEDKQKWEQNYECFFYHLFTGLLILTEGTTAEMIILNALPLRNYILNSVSGSIILMAA
jgi:hypothetical protein